ncbi:MAG TPA: hypothetical protein VG077_04790 [Verrucomicrobiae bacterium]|nr:hypothetical protein [Verrucomicrobiae bacterium]
MPAVSDLADGCPANPGTQLFKRMTDDSPSPWGEGRDEGGRKPMTGHRHWSTSGALPENVNYAVKSSFLLGFLESVPGVEAKLKKPNTTDEKFEDVVKRAQRAAVLVLVY